MKRKHDRPQRRTGEHNIFRVIQGARVNIIYEFAITVFAGLSSWPASIIEAFMRRDFGERYFTLSTSLFIVLIMAYIGYNIGELAGYKYVITWFLFAGIYFYKSIQHRKKIKKYGSAYNFDRFSLSDGRIHDFWWKIIGQEYYGVKITRYIVHVFLEPAVPFLAGLFLCVNVYTRGVGILLMICGFLFSFRSFAKAQVARNQILDMIDDQITAQYQRDVIMEDKPPHETAGLYFPIELPDNGMIRAALSSEIENDLNLINIWNDDDDNEEDETGEVLVHS